VAREILGRVAERQAHVPWDHRIPQQADHRARGQGGPPLWVLKPDGAEGRRRLEPAPARCHSALWRWLRLEPRGLWPRCWLQRGGQDGPSLRVLGGDEGRRMHAQAIADFDRRCLGLRWPPAA